MKSEQEILTSIDALETLVASYYLRDSTMSDEDYWKLMYLIAGLHWVMDLNTQYAEAETELVADVTSAVRNLTPEFKEELEKMKAILRDRVKVQGS